jgi:hypothetical protein
MAEAADELEEYLVPDLTIKQLLDSIPYVMSVESIVITQIPIWLQVLFREFPSLFDIYSARCYSP